MNMRLWECSKNIIDCFYSLENWTGQDAKWIGPCLESSDEDLDLFTKQWQAPEVENYWVGDGTNSTDCWSLPFSSGSSFGNGDKDPNFL